MELNINDQYYELDVGPEDILLQLLKDHLNLLYSINFCSNGECGACVVLVNNRPQKACRIKVGSLGRAKIKTIEGIPENDPVRKIWKSEDVQGCDYCKSGQILRAIALLARSLNPSDEDIKEALNTEHCKCGENPVLRRAIKKASKYTYDSCVRPKNPFK